jgi:hypothetical protein
MNERRLAVVFAELYLETQTTGRLDNWLSAQFGRCFLVPHEWIMSHPRKKGARYGQEAE